jgi:hypothetical protein
VRRAAGAVLAVVLGLVVVRLGGRRRERPNAADGTDESAGHEPTQTSVTLAWDASTDNSGSFSYSVNKGGQGFTVPQSRTTYTIDWQRGPIDDRGDQ